MNILVVTAHPLQDSLCTTLAAHTMDKLRTLGHNVVHENLYDNEFDPVLSPRERKTYYADAYHRAEVEAEIARLNHAEALVLVFPTWWFNFPAILKGWFDRVWAPTVAYDHATDYGPITPKLDRLRKTFVVTTLGAPWWVDYFLLWRPVKRILRVALLGACARRCRLQYLSFYKCEKVDEMRLQSFCAVIDRHLVRFFGQQ